MMAKMIAPLLGTRKIMLIAPNNKQVDILIKKVVEMVRRDVRLHDALIVHAHSETTETEAIIAEAKSRAKAQEASQEALQ